MSHSERDLFTPEQIRSMAIVQDVLRRRHAGENLPDAEVLQAHPDLARPLEDLLEKARAVAFLAEQAASEDGEDSHFKFDNDSQEYPVDYPWEEPIELPVHAEKNSEVTRLTVFEDFSSASRHLLPDAENRATKALPSDQVGTSTVQTSDARAEEFARKTLAIYGTPLSLRAERYCPKRRPPMGLLHIRDDSQLNAEVFRLRSDVTVIGRIQGDITIPHDLEMSGQHASISREENGGKFKWVLRDLDSRNGVFVRLRRAKLKDQDFLLIANRVVKFSGSGTTGNCSLQELREEGNADSLILERGKEYWLGRDPQMCVRFLSDEAQLNLRHARLRCDELGNWALFCCTSVNGVWIRVKEVRLIHRAAFQLGEQRFVFEAY